MKRLSWWIIASIGALLVVGAQDFTGVIPKGRDLPKIAIPDFRGAGDAQNFMGVFNQTLGAEVESSGQLKLISKSMMPAFTPQQPSDFVQPPPPQPDNPRKRGGQAMAVPQSGGGHWISDWSSPPASSTTWHSDMPPSRTAFLCYAAGCTMSANPIPPPRRCSAKRTSGM